jgi:homoserine kinase
MPASLDLVDRLRADGLAAVVSGAGPTVLCLVVDRTDLAAYCPDGWTHHRLGLDTRGAEAG